MVDHELVAQCVSDDPVSRLLGSGSSREDAFDHLNERRIQLIDISAKRVASRGLPAAPRGPRLPLVVDSDASFEELSFNSLPLVNSPLSILW